MNNSDAFAVINRLPFVTLFAWKHTFLCVYTRRLLNCWYELEKRSLVKRLYADVPDNESLILLFTDHSST